MRPRASGKESMKRTIVTGGVAAAAWLAVSVPGAASPRIAEGTEVFKGPMDPYGSIRFQALPSKRGKVPRLDRFRFKFNCSEELGPTGLSYGASAGSSVRPNGEGRFTIRDQGPDFEFALKGDFSRRYTKATGTFRFQGNVGDGVHTNCDTGKATWAAGVQP